jgi:uncharacterized protein YjcR
MGTDEDIIRTQRNYYLRLSEILELCKILDPFYSRIDELIQKLNKKREEFDGCKL